MKVDEIKSSQRAFEMLVWKHSALIAFTDKSELALFLCAERFCAQAILDPKMRWAYCRQTARELLRWKESFEDYLEERWNEVGEEWNEEEGEWESLRLPSFALSSGGYLIDTCRQEIVHLPYGASELLLEAEADANATGLRLSQVVALYNGAFNLNAHRDPRKARSVKERKRIEADSYLEKAWKAYRHLRIQRPEKNVDVRSLNF